jgi:hypothetical protein
MGRVGSCKKPKNTFGYKKKKVETAKTDWDAKSLIRRCVKQKKRGRLRPERRVKKWVELEKAEKREVTANVNRLLEGKKLNKKKKFNSKCWGRTRQPADGFAAVQLGSNREKCKGPRPEAGYRLPPLLPALA